MKKNIPSRLDKIIHDYAKKLREVYGDSLASVTLFGSYARGDFTDVSDIDVLVVVRLPEDELERCNTALANLTFETNLEHDIEIEPVVMSFAEYHYWNAVHPLLMQIKKDGVTIYEAA